MAKRPALPAEVDLDVVDVTKVALTTDPRGETMIGLEIAGGQVVNLIFSPVTLAKLEALLAKASQAQAQNSPIQ